MANPTMTLIQSVTVPSGGTSSINFTSIPSTYTDLCVKISGRDTDTAAYFGYYYVQVGNGSVDTGANYSWLYLYGSGSGTGSVKVSAQTFIDLTQGAGDSAGNTANTFTNIEMYCPNYAGSSAKSFSFDFVSEGNTTAGYDLFQAGLWSGTSAINTIKIYTTNTFVQYSTFYLYGIKNS